MAKLLLNVVLSWFDFGTDTRVGLYLWQKHPIWASLTFILMFFPGFIIGVFLCIQRKEFVMEIEARLLKPGDEMYKIYLYLSAVVSVFTFPLGALLVQAGEILSLLVDDSRLIKIFNFVTNGVNGMEAFLESGPQTILQMYIIFDTYQESRMFSSIQIFSIAVSVINISKTAILYDISMYNTEPGKLSVKEMIFHLVRVLPLYLSSTYFKVGTISLLCIYLKFWTVIPVAANFFILLAVAKFIMQFSVADSVHLSITNIVVVCVGPSRARDMEDSRFKFIAVSSLTTFVTLETSLVFLYQYSDIQIENSPIPKEILNMVILSLFLTGISVMFIVVASRFSDLRTDRSANQIFRALKREHREFIENNHMDLQGQLELSIKERDHPGLILYLNFLDEECTRQKQMITNRSKKRDRDKHFSKLDPLIWAIETENWEMFNLLMERSDLDIYREDSKGRTGISVAIKCQKIEMLKIMIKRREFESHRETKLGSGFQLAVSQKNDEIKNLMMEHESVNDQLAGVEVDVEKSKTDANLIQRILRFGITPADIKTVIIAVYAEDLKTLKRQLETGLSLEIHTKIPNEIIYNCGLPESSSSSDKSIKKKAYYLTLKNSFTLLSWSVWKGNMELTKLLLEYQSVEKTEESWNYLNDPIVSGWSPVSFQFRQRNRQMLTFLKTKISINMNQFLPNHSTPITWTIFKSDYEMFEFLCPFVDLQIEDGWGYNPYRFAKTLDRPKFIRLLESNFPPEEQTRTEESNTDELDMSSQIGFVSVVSISSDGSGTISYKKE